MLFEVALLPYSPKIFLFLSSLELLQVSSVDTAAVCMRSSNWSIFKLEISNLILLPSGSLLASCLFLRSSVTCSLTAMDVEITCEDKSMETMRSTLTYQPKLSAMSCSFFFHDDSMFFLLLSFCLLFFVNSETNVHL